MFAETYAKFFSFMALAVLCGVISMMIASNGVPQSRLAGMATQTGQTATATAPDNSIVFLFVGLISGVALLGGAMYIYHVERKKI